MKRDIADEILNLKEAVSLADVVIIAVPVNTTRKILPDILDNINEHTAVMDVGSTKKDICDMVELHPRRKNFVASHPMAGTEYSGPKAAFNGLFKNKVAVICDKERSFPDAVKKVETIYHALEMRLIYLNSTEHDVHVAYISHLSHAISFALATTVLKKEKDTSTIFDLASSGFQSTVRLAKSSSAMWTPIYEQNSENMIAILNEYISEISRFKKGLEENDFETIHNFIKEANQIRKILR